MEGLIIALIVLGLMALALVVPVIAIVALVRAGSLQKRLDQAEKRIAALERRAAARPHGRDARTPRTVPPASPGPRTPP